MPAPGTPTRPGWKSCYDFGQSLAPKNFRLTRLTTQQMCALLDKVLSLNAGAGSNIKGDNNKLTYMHLSDDHIPTNTKQRFKMAGLSFPLFLSKIIFRLLMVRHFIYKVSNKYEL